MAKIKSVRIWGFQSHSNTYYELDAGLNVFTGPTGGGKTSGTLRILNWLANGEPSGEGFLYTVYGPDGELLQQSEEAGVEVTLEDGNKIIKTRRKGKTRYFVTGYDEPFEKAEVPAVVKELLGIKSSSFGDFETDLNFAYQLAAPFLLSESASAGAKVLGKLSGTESIDGALKITAKDTHAARAAKSAADKEFESKSAALTEFEDLEEIGELLANAEELLEDLQNSINEREEMDQLRMTYRKVRADLMKISETLDELSELPAIEEDLKNVEEAQAKYDRLIGLYASFNRALQAADTLEENLKGLKNLDRIDEQISLLSLKAEKLNDMKILEKQCNEKQQEVKRLQGIVDATKGVTHAGLLLINIEAAYERLAKYYNLLGAYSIKVAQTQNEEELLAGIQENLKAAEEELKKAWEAAGGTCPLCEQVMEHKH